MANKKSKKSGAGKASAKNKKIKAASVSLGAVALAVAGFTLLSKKRRRTGGPPAPATGKLLETRPVLSHKMFSGKAAVAYKMAAEIPKVIDSQFCYCYCKRDHGHKTLLTCFTNTHGSKCGICMGEVIFAYELYKEKLSLDDIVVEIEDKFKRPYRGHKT